MVLMALVGAGREARLVDVAGGRAGEGRLAGTRARLGRLISAELERRGIRYTSLRQDLALTGSTFEAVIGRKLLAFVAGFLLVAATALGLQLAGISVPVGSPALFATAVGIGFFFIPDLDARRERVRSALVQSGPSLPAHLLARTGRVRLGGHGVPDATWRHPARLPLPGRPGGERGALAGAAKLAVDVLPVCAVEGNGVSRRQRDACLAALESRMAQLAGHV